MVNIYNIWLNYKLRSLQKMTLGSGRRLQVSSGRNQSADEASIRATGGEVGLVFIFWLLLVPLI
jgi:hypothetical protein